jgi:hypothetical protein
MRPQGDPEVEAQSEVAGDERIGEGADVVLGVRQQEWVFAQDRRSAEAGLAVDLRRVEPVMRLEPDAVVIDEADDRDRNREKIGREVRDAVERAVGRRVENIISPDGRETPDFRCL